MAFSNFNHNLKIPINYFKILHSECESTSARRYKSFGSSLHRCKLETATKHRCIDLPVSVSTAVNKNYYKLIYNYAKGIYSIQVNILVLLCASNPNWTQVTSLIQSELCPPWSNHDTELLFVSFSFALFPNSNSFVFHSVLNLTSGGGRADLIATFVIPSPGLTKTWWARKGVCGSGSFRNSRFVTPFSWTGQNLTSGERERGGSGSFRNSRFETPFSWTVQNLASVTLYLYFLLVRLIEPQSAHL